jgi:betaine-aldehyde dehydrogenase
MRRQNGKDRTMLTGTPRGLTDHQLLIGGEWQASASGETFGTHNPATGELLATIASANEADVDRAVAAAWRAAPEWRRRGPRERAALLERVAARLEAEGDRLAYIDSADCGNPLQGMRKDVRSAVEYIRYMCGIALELKGQTIPVARGVLDYTLRQPYGVVVRITPFNHPLMFAAQKIAAPLIAGNTVILKPSSLAPLAPLEFVRAIADILPPGVISIITGSGARCGGPLVRHPRVKRIAFTGSVETGQQLARDAADSGIKVLSLELGGKNPLIVLPDADLDGAVAAAASGMNLDWTLGQSCGSTSRALVHESLYDAFVGGVRAKFEALRMGIPTDEDTQLGCLVSRAQLEKVERYVASARSEGAQLVTGGTRPTDPRLARGFFFPPTLFAKVTPSMRIAREEIFGPVLSVIPWTDEAEMLEIAHDVPYGLSANIWTNNVRAAHRLADEIEAGFVWINGDGRHFTGAPFGGYKSSGIGSEESLDELLSYTQTKNVAVFM